MLWLLLCAYLLSLALIPRILLQKKRPVSTLAWIWAVLLFPFVGAAFYLLLGTERIRRLRLRRRRQFDAGRERERHSVTSLPPDLAENGRHLLAVIAKINRIPMSAGNEAELLLNGAEFYPALLQAIREAKHHIHLLFYIWRSDAIAAQLLESLEEAAHRGVEVRLLVDEIGSWRTPTRTFDKLRAAGGKFAWFLTLLPQRKLMILNLRNHRKLAVIDGQQAFVGGMNIGDEYLQRGKRLPVFLDAQLRLRGPVVLQLQEIFADDWYFATRKRLVSKRYYPQAPPPGQGQSVQLVSGGPDNSVDEIHLSLLHLLNEAKQRIWITSPYFVPDSSLLDAMRLAALRGVDVRLLFPAKSDHPWLQLIGRSFYEDLLSAGVRLFEYTPGFLHAKMMTVDGQWAMVGSANLDIRSFRLNYELNVLLPSPNLSAEIQQCIEDHLKASQEIHRAAFRQRPWRQKLLEALVRPFAPVS